MPPGRGRKVVDHHTRRKILDELKQLRDPKSRTGLVHGAYQETADRFGLHVATVTKIWRGYSRADVNLGPNNVPDRLIPDPLLLEQLQDRPRALLDDFAAWRLHYFGRKTPPFQVEIANLIARMVAEGELLALLLLCPPGFGKSVLMSHDLAIWLMLRARARRDRFACLLTSKGGELAEAFIGRIKRTLETHDLLKTDYGRFRPEMPDVWKKQGLLVDGFAPDIQGKEPTFIASGSAAQIYGWRVTLALGDDLLDKKNSGTPEMAEAMEEWFHEDFESRIDTGGGMACIGTRYQSFDMYGRLLKAVDEDDQPLYTAILYRAHDESRCSGTHCQTCRQSCPHDKPYPEGCLLWPEQMSWLALKRKRAAATTRARFEFQYNQADTPSTDTLVAAHLVEAAKDPTRTMWRFAPGGAVAISLDTSPTQYAAAEVWQYFVDREGQFDADGEPRITESLIAIRRSKMTTPVYISLMEDWTLRTRAAGFDPLWVIEVNGAHQLLQSSEFLTMKQRLRLRVIPHSTTRNKLDPEYGLQLVPGAFEAKRVSLPWGDPETREAVQPFVTELTTYPYCATDDTVLAYWFFRHHRHTVAGPKQNGPAFIDYPGMPSYLKDRRRLVKTA